MSEEGRHLLVPEREARSSRDDGKTASSCPTRVFPSRLQGDAADLARSVQHQSALLLRLLRREGADRFLSDPKAVACRLQRNHFAFSAPAAETTPCLIEVFRYDPFASHFKRRINYAENNASICSTSEGNFRHFIRARTDENPLHSLHSTLSSPDPRSVTHFSVSLFLPLFVDEPDFQRRKKY